MQRERVNNHQFQGNKAEQAGRLSFLRRGMRIAGEKLFAASIKYSPFSATVDYNSSTEEGQLKVRLNKDEAAWMEPSGDVKNDEQGDYILTKASSAGFTARLIEKEVENNERG